MIHTHQFRAAESIGLNDHFHFILFSPILLHRKSSSLHSMSHQWMTINPISLQCQAYHDLCVESNFNIGLVLDLGKNRNLWYMWLKMLKPHLGPQNWNPASLSFNLEKLMACILFISYLHQITDICSNVPYPMHDVRNEKISRVPWVKSFSHCSWNSEHLDDRTLNSCCVCLVLAHRFLLNIVNGWMFVRMRTWMKCQRVFPGLSFLFFFFPLWEYFLW